ncbi:MAG: hypothetical protein ABIR14_01300, partial [Candidatus Paceibacterota bacterium]
MTNKKSIVLEVVKIFLLARKKKVVRISKKIFLIFFITIIAFSHFPFGIKQAEAVASGDGKTIYGESTVTTPRTRDWTGSWSGES